MEIFNIEFYNWSTVLFRFNWLAIIILLAGFLCMVHLIKRFLWNKSIVFEEYNLGIGSSSVKLTYNKKDREIAYKLWVELSTRKIGILFDKENDVIVEVYNSWYDFFRIARELLKEVPIDKTPYSENLIKLTEKVLNKGLRPHLTIWQAKYRKWYESELNNGSNDTPQELQRKYPYYNELVEDLIITNKRILEYKELMRKIALEKDNRLN